MNAAWAMGALIGPAAGGAVAAAIGDVVPFLVSAGFCAAALAAVRRAQHRTTARAVLSQISRARPRVYEYGSTSSTSELQSPMPETCGSEL